MGKYNFDEEDTVLLSHSVQKVENFVELEKIEQYAFFIRSFQIEQGIYKVQGFTFNDLVRLHHHLFQDVYTFAVEVRNVQLTKGNTRFCQFQFIETMAKEIFKHLENESEWLTTKEAAKRIAYFKAELNMLHPFREGNGRTIRIFIQNCAQAKGYMWHYNELQQDEYIQAMIESTYNTTKLEEIIFNTLEKL
ncbi:Fic/DOC family protein [Ureibacillus sp. MALMAid1270]|uniref:Fic/DOC family protein n=1 Tax=Ureibacillus sp. MALMAid1270 TaxID=3411629 RepID=UPI003BA5BE02